MMKNLCMKSVLSWLILFFVLFCYQLPVSCSVLQGGVNENSRLENNCKVIDKITRKPICGAKVLVPSKGLLVYTDKNGCFSLNANFDKQTVLSVEKQNYKLFSITLNRYSNTYPLVLELEISTPFDIKLETHMCHLGDDNYSTASANAYQFKAKSIGPVLNREFYISNNSSNKDIYLVFGSIVGIDTALARGLGQNSITTAFASPPSVYLNGHKISEIQINGDNQRIKLPKQFIKFNQKNLITIKAGRNLMQRAYVDYDDFEFMNLSIQ